MRILGKVDALSIRRISEHGIPIITLLSSRYKVMSREMQILITEKKVSSISVWIVLFNYFRKLWKKKMANPNYFKLRDYLQSLIDMTIEAENKNSIYYYFPIDSRDLAKNMELIK